ncbi:MAG: hypothetical protein Q8L88_00565 [Bacteroidota bacterium]|nr:hypothetical protein [Bacteroidota bacterium]
MTEETTATPVSALTSETTVKTETVESTVTVKKTETVTINHRYSRPNRTEYDEMFKKERQLTKRVDYIKDRIAQKKTLITKGYKLVETDGKTKKRLSVKREREEIRRSQSEHLRVEAYELEKELIKTRYELKETRNKLSDMGRALKYFAKFDKKVEAESQRSQYNPDLFVNRAVQTLKKKKTDSVVFKISERTSEETVRKNLLIMLVDAAPAMFEVFSRRDSLISKLIKAFAIPEQKMLAVSGQ